METILLLFKIDLGVTHDKRDTYFNALINSCVKELKGKGVALDFEDVEDQMLVSDYALWRYRNRQQNVSLSNNLQLRIRNAIVKGRAADGN